MDPIAGWYDDPQDGSRLRYWDGDEWTSHVLDKPPPSTAAGTPDDAASQWRYPGAPPAQERVWQYGGPQHPSYPQQQAPVGTTPGSGPRTPDGEAISSWGRRCGARLLDLLIVAVGSLPFTAYFLYQTIQAIADQRDTPGASTWIPDATVIKWEASLLAMYFVVAACYEMFCLHHFDTTIGKRLLEVKVRLFDQAGRLRWSTVARRVAVIYVLLFLNLVPILSLPALILLFINFLWPLWDPRRQALHDKVARTVVVDSARPPSRPVTF